MDPPIEKLSIELLYLRTVATSNLEMHYRLTHSAPVLSTVS